MCTYRALVCGLRPRSSVRLIEKWSCVLSCFYFYCITINKREKQKGARAASTPPHSDERRQQARSWRPGGARCKICDDFYLLTRIFTLQERAQTCNKIPNRGRAAPLCLPLCVRVGVWWRACRRSHGGCALTGLASLIQCKTELLLMRHELSAPTPSSAALGSMQAAHTVSVEEEGQPAPAVSCRHELEPFAPRGGGQRPSVFHQ